MECLTAMLLNGNFCNKFILFVSLKFFLLLNATPFVTFFEMYFVLYMFGDRDALLTSYLTMKHLLSLSCREQM